ncbi:hypothetical protein SAMN04490244_10170 [Tranquillimonas rosea]|uniref:Uncharacterized protein n=1 Tax=Tranquillimonas rosea TaxID=641238 RepID=A0A1H9P8U3_9RHOB|nr:hypothetical protein [Tranquillimonas rosea]SER44517.1 hypothetical protein SAMN04490244_10170 [Tranquillimonas rosea]
MKYRRHRIPGSLDWIHCAYALAVALGVIALAIAAPSDAETADTPPAPITE